MSWRAGEPQDLVFLQRGFDITKNEQKPGDIPVISSSGIQSYHSEAKVQGPGIIIGRKGTLGSVYYSKSDYWPHDTTLWSKDLKGNNPRFIYYYLKTLRLENYDVGNSNPTLNRNHIHMIHINIPTPDIQANIVNLLSPYDEMIENNRRRIALLEQAARLLYQEWFVHLRFPGHEHIKITNRVPESWEKGIVSDLGMVITGKTPSTKNESYYGGNIPFVKTPDMHDQIVVVNTEDTLTETGAKSQPNKFIPKGSVMVSCIGTVGVVAIASVTCQTNQQINAIVFYDSMASYYGFFALSQLKPLLEGMGGGATMCNVNKTKFSSIPVLMPDGKILADFNVAVSPIFSQIETLELINIKLTNARNLLLPRLMNGEISV